MPKINHEEYKILKGLDDQWRWIARDKNRCLYVFTGKPVKKYGPLLYWGTEGFLSFELFDEKDLFQFIQWEDGEPYSIQELIHDYEYKTGTFDWATALRSALHGESEGTEVKRNLKEAILGIEVTQFDGYKADLEEFVNPRQLEEIIDDWMPEVLSSNWIKDNQLMWTSIHGSEYYVPANKLYEKLVPKRELPAIPKFVAEWINEMKQDERPLYSVMSSLMNKTNHEWGVWKIDNKNFSEIVAQAWLDGFTVEEKPKYYAKIKGHENISSDDKYWNYCITDESLDIGENKVHADVLAEYVLSATKDEWEYLGINDDNSDFILVEEL